MPFYEVLANNCKKKKNGCQEKSDKNKNSINSKINCPNEREKNDIHKPK